MAKNIDLLLGKIALEKGYVTRRQLDDCIVAQEQEQRETGILLPLGEIMVSRGIIDNATLQELIKLQQEKFQKAAEFAKTRHQDGIFGALVIKRNLATSEKVHECLRIQAQMADRDVHLRLGEVLVRKGYLTASQVREVLLLQRKVIMTCPTCKRNYNVPGRKDGVTVKCPKCSTVLKPPDLDQTISAADTAHPDASAPAPPPPRLPEEAADFGRYDLLEQLGEGGMGVVYKTWDKQLRRLVALKMLKASESELDPKQVERFLREARASAKLRHTNIVQIHDIGTIGNKHYFTMDFIEGCSLKDMMTGAAADPTSPASRAEQAKTTKTATSKEAADSGARKLRTARLPLRKGLKILCDVSLALAHAHAQGLIHRDIKPANILIDAAGVPYLTDFGLAKDIKHLEKSGLTVDGQIIGTPVYLSPELAAGEQSKLSPASDIYSLGIIMYELLAGKIPYEADSFIALMWEIIHKDPPSPRSLSSRIHRDLDTICIKAIEKEPERRYATAKEFAEDIQRYLNGEAISAAPPGRAYRVWRTVRRHAAVSVGIATALLAIVVGGGYFLHSSAERRREARTSFSDGVALMEKGDWNAALDRLQNAAHFDPDNKQIATRIEQCKQLIAQSGEIAGTERRKAATPAYERAKVIVERLDELAKRGEFKKGKEDLQLAVVELDSAIGRDPSFADAFFLKGRILVIMAKEDEALLALQKAIELNPTFAAPYFERASLLLDKYFEAASTQTSAALVGAMGDYSSDAQDILATQVKKDSNKELLKPAIESDLRKVFELGVRPEEIHCTQGELLSLDGKAQEAIAEFGKAISIYPYYAEAYRWRGFAYLLTGKVNEALQDYDKAIECRPFSAELYFSRGQAQLMANDSGAAILDFTKALEIRPDWGDLLICRGVTYIRLGRIDAALNDLDKAVEHEPDKGEVYAYRAYAKVLVGNAQGALEDAKKAHQMEPDNLIAIAFLGLSYGTSGNADEGIKLLNEAILKHPKNLLLLGNRASLHAIKGNMDAALADIEKACRLAPDRSEFVLTKARMLLGTGALDRALATIESAIDKNDKVADYYTERATIFLMKGDAARAMADIDKALELNPTHSVTLLVRAQLRLNKNDVAGAEADLDAAIKADPGCTDAYLQRGNLRHIQKNLQGAIDVYTAGLKAVPGDTRLLFARGILLETLGDYAGALADYTEIISHNPNDFNACVARARTNIAKKNWETALSDLDRALALNANLAEGYSLRGDCYREMGKRIKAQIDYEKAIELNPNYEMPHAGLGLVYMQEDRPDLAIPCFTTFLRLASPNHPWTDYVKGLLAEAEKRK